MMVAAICWRRHEEDLAEIGVKEYIGLISRRCEMRREEEGA